MKKFTVLVTFLGWLMIFSAQAEEASPTLNGIRECAGHTLFSPFSGFTGILINPYPTEHAVPKDYVMSFFHQNFFYTLKGNQLYITAAVENKNDSYGSTFFLVDPSIVQSDRLLGVSRDDKGETRNVQLHYFSEVMPFARLSAGDQTSDAATIANVRQFFLKKLNDRISKVPYSLLVFADSSQWSRGDRNLGNLQSLRDGLCTCAAFGVLNDVIEATKLKILEIMKVIEMDGTIRPMTKEDLQCPAPSS